MWKFNDITATQILCEINYGDLEPPKTAILTILSVLNFEFLEIVDILKCEVPKNRNSKPQKLLKWQLLTF